MELAKYFEINLNDNDLFFPEKVNIVLIETDQYAGNFEQNVCENVFGTEYSEYIRTYQSSEEYLEDMKKRGYEPDYFMNLSQDCKHDEYGDVIASIFKTPGTGKNYPSPHGDSYAYSSNTVALFFQKSLSDKDIATIKDIAIETLKGKANVLDIGQLEIKMERKISMTPTL